jgi:hypothetical protein
MKEVRFGYGVLNEPLEHQAYNQGFTLGEDAKRLELSRNGINVARVNGFITDSEFSKITKRLNDKVIKSLKPLKEFAE